MALSRADESPAAGSVTSVIGSGTVIAGTIVFSGALRVDGEVRGKLLSPAGQPGALTVGGKGRVEGEVEVDRVVVDGSVSGKVSASASIVVHSGARVQCELSYGAIEIDPGAVIEGQVSHRVPAAPAITPEPGEPTETKPDTTLQPA
jgi:cytoskeletal protein CcmA (bactofilin family)